MKYLTTTALILALAMPATAGGVVLSAEETTEATPKRDRVPLWVFLALGVVVAAAISGNDDVCFVEEEPVEPEQPSGGC